MCLTANAKLFSRTLAAELIVLQAVILSHKQSHRLDVGSPLALIPKPVSGQFRVTTNPACEFPLNKTGREERHNIEYSNEECTYELTTHTPGCETIAHFNDSELIWKEIT
jgi:hypothetical protein